MKTFAKEFVIAVLVPLAIGLGGAMIGARTNIAVLEERIDNVKVLAATGIAEAKQLAQGAHARIDTFLLGSGS